MAWIQEEEEDDADAIGILPPEDTLFVVPVPPPAAHIDI